MSLKLNGATSGSIELDVPAAIGSDLNVTLPATAGEISVKGTDGSVDFGDVNIDSSNRLLVGTSSSSQVGAGLDAVLQIEGTTQSNSRFSILRRSASAVGPTIAFGKTGGSGDEVVAANDSLGTIDFSGGDGTDVKTSAARIQCEVDGIPGLNDMPGRLVFSTTADGANSPTERMRIISDGKILFGTTSATNASSSGITFVPSTNGRVLLDIGTTSTATAQLQRFFNGNGQVGSISTNGTATAYNTSSDYRLKENVVAVADGITRLQQLKPSRFNFIADPARTVDGFLAHEVQDIVPEAVAGEKDAVDDDGNPEYQGIDQSKLVPLLTAALQEAVAKIETLEAKVAVLEANP
jgi:hypothetical protein